MTEGWLEDDYLILFTDDEAVAATQRYGIELALPAFKAVGLRGWDDFLVRDSGGGVFTVPTVPIDAKYLEPYNLPVKPVLKSDSRFEGKIKWYVKPLIFGGDAADRANLTWVSHRQHSELVVWWNDTYRKHKDLT